METTWVRPLVSSESGGKTPVDSPYEQAAGLASKQIRDYLLERVPKFRELTELRDKGWRNPAGDEYFAKQRRQADNSDDQQAEYFFSMMKRNAECQTAKDTRHGVYQTLPFMVSGSPVLHHIAGSMMPDLDISTNTLLRPQCMAPGGFLYLAMKYNPGAYAQAFSLPVEKGGHKVLLPQHPNITVDYVDITMLGADMGVDAIPQDHPDAHNFLPRKFYSRDAFDLVICDGQVLRTHSRAAYRGIREPSRLILTQLTIALEHIVPGGNMLVLLHKVETWRCVLVLRAFSRFSNVQLFKPRTAHAKRSSCYMVASNIQPQHEDAIRAVREWKRLWRTATFNTEEEYASFALSLEPKVEGVLQDFGPKLMDLGKSVWETQAIALARAPFVRGQRG
ncbi:hypothetical protein NUW58_g2964 [Xylaria curta]|uniref:Uncharacterized protein n=1 Tax=Xylaria curta TaxID=42375 RepID=A0ACC1PG90_9PEZI|nr:hypothetical protein NUW58_g2964 [Xylaria curta]